MELRVLMELMELTQTRWRLMEVQVEFPLAIVIPSEP